MGESGGFDGEIDLPGGSFSRFLLSKNTDDNKYNTPTNLDISSNFHVATAASPPLFSCNTPKLLCFGDYDDQFTPLLSSPSLNTAYTDSSSASPTAHHPITVLNNKRRNGPGVESGSGQGSGNGQKAGKKKNKPELGPAVTAPVGHAKSQGRREKLGERITALQQLVCPYGKTDTASVLHEAMGYIRFLQDQVKVLSSPYLQQRLPSSLSHQPSISATENGVMSANGTKVLRSRGLCLVPVECVVDITNSNGADFWSSTANTFAP